MGGTCVCPTGKQACGATCVDPTQDPTNCGACGHDCLGGSCQASVCQPKLIASQNGPTAIAVNASSIVWAAGGSGTGTLSIANLDGTGLTQLVTTGLNQTNGLAADSATAYLATGTNLYRCALAGCSNAPTKLTPTTFTSVRAIALSGTNLYYVDFGTYNSQNGAYGAVGTATGVVTPFGLNRPSPVSLSLSGDNAVVGEYGAFLMDVFQSNEDILYFKPSLGSTSVSTQYNGPSNLELLVVATDGTRIYWSYDNATSIYMCPGVGQCAGSPVVIQDTGGHVYGMVADGNYVYWTGTAGSSGQVGRCPATGCTGSPTLMATGQNLPTTIVQDAKALYWITQNAVMKVAK